MKKLRVWSLLKEQGRGFPLPFWETFFFCTFAFNALFIHASQSKLTFVPCFHSEQRKTCSSFRFFMSQKSGRLEKETTITTWLFAISTFTNIFGFVSLIVFAQFHHFICSFLLLDNWPTFNGECPVFETATVF